MNGGRPGDEIDHGPGGGEPEGVKAEVNRRRLRHDQREEGHGGEIKLALDPERPTIAVVPTEPEDAIEVAEVGERRRPGECRCGADGAEISPFEPDQQRGDRRGDEVGRIEAESALEDESASVARPCSSATPEPSSSRL